MLYPWLDLTWASVLKLRAKLPHALLIHGPAGVGKLAMAKALAQLMLCDSASTGAAACGRCEGCRWFAAGSHPDMRWVQPESTRIDDSDADVDEPRGRAKAARPSTEIRVDEVRELRAFLNIGSHRGGRRIALVHPAESMNVHAANSLLKNLEEPPSGAMFILVSHRPARLLPTIRSRCVSIPVALPERKAAQNWLEAQGVAGAGSWLAFAGGAPLRALDYSAPESADEILRLLNAAAAGDAAALGAVSERESLERLAEILQKVALDSAFAASGGKRKYTPESVRTLPATKHAWLSYARRMGINRTLSRHPLNPRLFAAEMLSAMPQGRD
jgi:DNA polymerase III subunit delta'